MLPLWSANISKNQQRVFSYATKQSVFKVSDSILQETAYWSKACIAANIHYINDWFVPMPCPAEYNFFFTHDLLLTGLGVVYFDLSYVKQGFQFLKFLTKEDSILPHAYYWKDDRFVTEYCQSDNWNHLWFIIAAGSYLKHSDDIETIRSVFPVISKSLKMMLENRGQDDLMYARRPDWWDTGNVYGARAYITILMHKVLKDYVYVVHRLHKKEQDLGNYLKLADRLKKQLVSKLWDDESGYLLNMLDQKTIDRHFYSGSLLAVYYDLLDNGKKHRLLQSAKQILLDQNIGIRNVMPADFHEKIQIYHFQGMESGLAYTYLNGGIWPHANAWFALGLISNNQPDEAKTVISKYLTLQGIRNSPQGQPSFYEYRFADPASPRYGEIDKPTFLWAAGWYLHVLYQLAGLRENSFNIHFNPMLPKEFDKTEYDLTLNGKLCRIKWSGEGKYFRKIKQDGKLIFSAVISPHDEPREIEFVSGNPLTPYLADANCIINTVRYYHFEGKLAIEVSGVVGQEIELTIVSPNPLRESAIGSLSLPNPIYDKDAQGYYTYRILTTLPAGTNQILLYFT
jgi:glycogen debranching enzyme